MQQGEHKREMMFSQMFALYISPAVILRASLVYEDDRRRHRMLSSCCLAGLPVWAALSLWGESTKTMSS